MEKKKVEMVETGKNGAALYPITLLSFMFWLGYAGIQPIMPLYVVKVGASMIQLGIIMSIPPLFSALTRIPSALIIINLDQRLIALGSAILQSIAIFLYSLVPNPVYFYPICAIFGLSYAVFVPSAFAVAAGLAPHDKIGETMGKYQTSFGLAMLVGPLLTGLFTTFLDFKSVFILEAFFSIFGVAVFSLGNLYFSRGTKHLSYDHRAHNLEKANPIDALRNIAKSKNVLVVSLYYIIIAYAKGVFLTIFPLWATEVLHFTPAVISLFYSISGLTNALVRFPAGELFDRLGWRKPLMIGFASLMSVFFILPAARGFLTSVLVMILYGTGFGMGIVSTSALLARSTPKKQVGMAQAFVMTLFSLGETIGPSSAGVMALSLPTENIFTVTACLFIPAAFTLSLIRLRFKVDKP